MQYARFLQRALVALAFVAIACGGKSKAKDPPIGMDVPVGTDDSPPGIGSAAAPNETAIVVSDEAIVRDAPNSTGKVLARLGNGSKVNVLSTAGAWINIAYGADGETGWTFHTSLGR
ncbi:MAG: SH3 domain-containing protein [Polyangiales bacterium]